MPSNLGSQLKLVGEENPFPSYFYSKVLHLFGNAVKATVDDSLPQLLRVTNLVEGLVRVCQVEEVLEFQVVEHHEPDLFGHVREVVAVSPAELQYVLEGVQAVHVGYLVLQLDAVEEVLVGLLFAVRANSCTVAQASGVDPPACPLNLFKIDLQIHVVL